MGFSKNFLIILLIAFLLRIVIAFWSLGFRENTDVLRYKDWARIAYLHNFASTYKTDNLTFGTLPNNQPPGSLYILSGAYQVELQTAKVIFKITHTTPSTNLWVNGPLLTLFLRLPSIIADCILGYLIYLFVRKRKTEKAALIGSGLFLFAPPVWYNSAFWGQMDGVNNLAFFAAVFFLYNKKYFTAILFSFLSLFIKFSLLPAIPLFLVLTFINRQEKKWQLIPMILASLGIILLLTIPVAGGNFLWFVDFAKKNGIGEMQNITNFAFNFWFFVFKPVITFGNPTNLFSFSSASLKNIPLLNFHILGIAINQFAILLFLAASLPFLILTYRKRGYLTTEMGIIALTITVLLGFMLLPTMHERYLYPVLPLLATYTGLTNKYLFLFIFICILNFLNLYVVWHPMTLVFLPYTLIANPIFQWLVSAGMVGATVYLYITSFRTMLLYGKK